jgi:lipopolysaccharide transport system ATP-binding protein
MDDGIAIRVSDLGKRFVRGWEPHVGMRRLVEQLLHAPLNRLGQLFNRLQPSAAENYFWALRGVSFEIPTGQITGLVGANGAGKSVLLKILSRVMQPNEGYAEIRGRIGAILEGGAGFHPELTGLENLRLTGAVYGMDRDEVRRKLDAIAAFAEVGPFLDTPVKRYSSGMAVRLALAVAVHLEREVLLVDEILAMGDEAFRNKCIDTIRSLSANGRTVMFVSHDRALVSQLCRRCLYLEGGRLIDDGPTAEILARYGARARWKAHPAAGEPPKAVSR